MDITEALNFLNSNQPLPSSYLESSNPAIQKFSEITEFLTDAAPLYPEALDLVFGAIGEGDGHGAYANVDSLIWSHPDEIVIPVLVRTLSRQRGNAVAFAAMFACAYPDERLVAPLASALLDEKGNDISSKSYAIMSLAALGKNSALKHVVSDALKGALYQEQDPSIRCEIAETLKQIAPSV